MVVRIPKMPTKDPNEVLDYQVDWSDRLGADEISTSDFSVVSGTVTIDSEDSDTTTATVFLSGGTLGETCQILNRIVTTGARTFDQTFSIRIATR